MASTDESFWSPEQFKQAQAQGIEVRDNPRSVLPPLAGWGQAKPETRDFIVSGLMGLQNSLRASQEAAAYGDPFGAALAGIAGSVNQPGAQNLATQRQQQQMQLQQQQRQAQMEQLESTPVDLVSPGLVAKHPELKGLPLGMINKIAPILSRQDSMEQQLAMFLAREQGANARQERAIEAGKEKSQRGKDAFQMKEEARLRGELEKLSKDFRTIEGSYRTISSVAKKPSAAGDLSMIFAYMKLLDPGSTVREGEQATAENARGVPDQIRNLANKMLTGQKLGAAQRQDFVNQAQGLYQTRLDSINVDRGHFRDLGERLGLRPENIDLSGGGGKSKKDPLGIR